MCEIACTVFIGNIIHCTDLFKVEVLENSFVAVVGNKIAQVGKIENLPQFEQSAKYRCVRVRLSESQILIPGLIDTHIHACQYPNAGLGYDKQLLDWLQTYTFPLETKYADVNFARQVYKNVVEKTLAHGTTTACYFATLHIDPSVALAEACIAAGQRAFVGKVNMVDFCPDFYKETNESSLRDTETVVRKILDKKCDLVQPIITPRFAVSCDEKLMTELGKIAAKYDLNIQSHISENLQEIDLVKEKFGKGYAQVYDDCKLLTRKTVMAHGVHLTKDEMKLLAQRGTSVSHCPGSNCCLQSGNCDVRTLVNEGVNVGLGTDVSGGPSPSIIESMRRALDVSIQHTFADRSRSSFTYKDVFYLATLGGAKALAVDNKVGNFTKGKEFDALIVDMNVKNSNVDYFQSLTPLELLQKMIYSGDDRNVKEVYVSGQKVKCC